MSRIPTPRLTSIWRFLLFGVLAVALAALPMWTSPYYVRIGTGVALWAGLACRGT